MKRVFQFIEQQWGPLDPLGKNLLEFYDWETLTAQAFQKKISLLKAEAPLKTCIRLVGQSGSGKTSQLLPALKSALNVCEKTFISFAVRDFVEFHPHLNEIKESFGESLLREKTNAFALTLLTLVFKRCVEAHLPILFEVTLLSPLYEDFIHRLLVEENYGCDYQCLAISKFISDKWIQARFLQTQRIVSKDSSDFFFNTLRPAMELIKTFPLNNRVFIWGKNERNPVITSLQDQNFIDLFFEMQNSSGEDMSLEEGLRCKKEFLCKFYHKNGFLVS